MRLDRFAFVAGVVLAMPSAVMAQSTEDSWRLVLPDHCRRNLDMPTVELAHAWEVPKSMFSVAADRLADQEFIVADEALAEWYRQGHYTPEPERTPYLVRAVYGFGGTGRFYIFCCDTDLVVSHQSLGKSWEENNTGLIVNLEKRP